jgi:hypothetical protein
MAEKHGCAPEQFRDTDNITGDYCLDSTIEVLSKRIDWNKLNMHLNTDTTYSPKTAGRSEKN